MNRLANLQILDSVVNNEKEDKLFSEWISVKYPDKHSLEVYKQDHFIPESVSCEFADFLDFIQAREVLLETKIKEAFPSNFDKLVERYLLQDKI